MRRPPSTGSVAAGTRGGRAAPGRGRRRVGGDTLQLGAHVIRQRGQVIICHQEAKPKEVIRISLDQVANVADAAPLVGDVVTATGEATVGSRGQIVGLTGAVVESTQLPGWTQTALADVITDAKPPPAGGDRRRQP